MTGFPAIRRRGFLQPVITQREGAMLARIAAGCLSFALLLPPSWIGPCTGPERQARDSEFEARRREMVRTQIADRGVSDTLVLRAMRTVPRHRFVPADLMSDAYDDHPLPIGYHQTISQPYIVAFMTELLRVRKGMKVLEIGTGSGYQAAILAELVDTVFTIEIVRELAAIARERFRELGYRNIVAKAGDGYAGWPEHAPFDAIIVTAAVNHIPRPLIDQLADGGRMVLPEGEPYGAQSLVTVRKSGANLIVEDVLPVRFVPLTREP
jgi:protein-L-isoaspartate(D-aspartate) O-methyltransferase